MLRKIRNLTLFGLGSLLLAALFIVGVYLPYGRAYGLVHPARTSPGGTPAEVGITHYEDLRLTTSDGLKLAAWYIPPKNGAVVICIHGLGVNRGQFLGEAAFLHRKGFGVLLLDLRNHGKSEGTKTTFGLDETRDIAAAVAFIRQREGPETPIAAFGHSLGAVTALLAAVQIPEIRAVIAVSAFASLESNINEGVRVLTGLDPRYFAPQILFFGQLQAGVDISTVRPVEVIGKISPRPVLLIHGAKDDLLPARNSLELYAAAGEPKELVIYPGVGHGGFIFQEPKLYPKKVGAFLEKYLLP
jgi:fermentation-respiration switch protein FrsA (DUF1100 family)